MKKIFSMPIVMVVLLIFGIAMAVATFVESNYVTLFGQQAGEAISHQKIYSSIWFGLLQVFVVVGLIYQFLSRKLYKKKSFFMVFFHASIVVMLVGAIITRYFGFEGIMHIREGKVSNLVLSKDNYVTIIKIDQNTKVRHASILSQQKISTTLLSGSSFSSSNKVDGSNLDIKSVKFLPIFKEEIVPSSSGIPMIKLVLSNRGDTVEHIIQNGTTANFDGVTISLNDTTKKADISIVTKDGKFFIKSRGKLGILTLATRKRITLRAGKSREVVKRSLYTYSKNINFVFTNFLASGKVKYSSKNIHNESVLKMASYSAYVADVTYKGVTKKVILKGTGNGSVGTPVRVDFGNFAIVLTWGSKVVHLPFLLYLQDFKLDRYAGSNVPSSYKSIVSIINAKGENMGKKEIFMNHVLDYKGFRFFQTSYDSDEQGTILTVNHDPGKLVTYIGYFMLIFGLFFSFFFNGRFKTLMKTKYVALLLSVMFFSPNISHAKSLDPSTMSQKELISFVSKIDKTHAKRFAKLLVEGSGGRIKPINTLGIDILNKVARTTSIYGLSSDQIILGMLVYPDYWQYINIIKVDSKKINKKLGLDPNLKRINYHSLFDKNGDFKLKGDVEDANMKPLSARENYEKSLIKVSERVNVLYTTFSSSMFKMFPKQHSKSNKWLSITEIKHMLSQKKGFSPAGRKEVMMLDLMIGSYFQSIDYAVRSGKWGKADDYLTILSRYQEVVGKKVLLPKLRIKAEILSNKLNIFAKLIGVYIIVGLCLVILMFLKLFNVKLSTKRVTKVFTVIIILAFIAHTVGLALRWYISGHAPWSDAFEGLVFISWCIILAGIVMNKNSHLILGTTSVLAGISLFVAHLSYIDPQITNLVPVLKSYWLMVHVSIITSSYGFLSLCALLGLFSIIFYILLPVAGGKYRENIILSIKETDRVNQMSMILGLALLSAGNFLGGVWANESWGRYWSWDPKETWALISIVVYIIVVHFKYIPFLRSRYAFAVGSLVAFFSIIMTYFGVNYYLSGMHSYAKDNGAKIPDFAYVMVLVLVVLIVVSFRNRKEA